MIQADKQSQNTQVASFLLNSFVSTLALQQILHQNLRF